MLLGLYLLILEPILRADRYYNDDLKRALVGRTGWDSTGRPLATLLMKVLQCYDHALVDISPLTQIGAIAILAFTGMLIARKYVIGSLAIAALVAFPLGAQPFFLENLSYKFDALTMSAAMFLSLLPVLLLNHTRAHFWWGVLALFTGLNFYQPAINAYLIFVVLEVALNCLETMRPGILLRQACWRLLQAATAMTVYHILVGIHVNGWVRQKSVSIHAMDQLPVLATNFSNVLHFIGNGFNEHWWMYFTPAVVFLSLLPIVAAVRYWIAARQTDHLWTVTSAALLCISLPAIGLACLLGPMIVLIDPPIVPRVLPSVGALLAASLIFMHRALRNWNFSVDWSLFVGSVFALGMATIASAYGNASGEQKEFEDRIASRVADDLADLARSRNLHSYLLNGAAGYAPVTRHIAEQLPIVRALVPTYLAGDDTFHTHIYLSYYIHELADLRDEPNSVTSQRIAAITAQSDCAYVTRRAASYDVRVVEDVAVITLHGVAQ